MRLKTDIADYRYLVVDDDVLISALITSMLRKMGATKVDIAENGEVALKYIGADRKMPDIIISDLHMPQLDGVEFIHHLAEKQFAGGIILISSANKRFLRIVSNLAEANQLNVLGALSKPFTRLTLQGMLDHSDETKKNKHIAGIARESVIEPGEQALAKVYGAINALSTQET